MKLYNIINMLNVLKEQSECIDKQVSCIITDRDNNILSFGWNKIIACNKDCHNKESRICNTVHAEVVALSNLNENNRHKAYRVYVSLFPCIPCQEECIKYGIKEIVSFSPNHKGKKFNNIVYKEMVEDMELHRNTVDTFNTINVSKKDIDRIEYRLVRLANSVYEAYIDKSWHKVYKNLIESEIALNQLKLVLWSKNPEAYNLIKGTREKVYSELYDKLKKEEN